jgi:hypothetical protein
MKLLIISLHYAPEETGNAPYAAGLAEHLAGQGHEVTVVTGLPHYPSWRVFDGYRRRPWLREKRGGAEHGLLMAVGWTPGGHCVMECLSSTRLGV